MPPKPEATDKLYQRQEELDHKESVREQTEGAD